MSSFLLSIFMLFTKFVILKLSLYQFLACLILFFPTGHLFNISTTTSNSYAYSSYENRQFILGNWSHNHTQRNIGVYRSGSWREDGRRGDHSENVKLLRLTGSHVGYGRQQQSLKSAEFGFLLPKHHHVSMAFMFTASQWHSWVSINKRHGYGGHYISEA